MKRARAEWFAHRLPAIAARPDRVVFLDESAVKTDLARLRGRSPRGARLGMEAPFGRWGTQTMIAGVTADVLIAPWVIEGAMDGPTFATYLRHVLVPAIEPGTVVVLDTLSPHRSEEAAVSERCLSYVALTLARPLGAGMA